MIDKINEANQKLNVEIFNFELDRYQIMPTFPFMEPLILRGCFVELQIIKLRVTEV